MGLIDGYAAAKHLKKRLIETALNNVGIMASADDVYREMAKNRIDVWIDEIPTVDAVEVIRCNDCKYWDFSDIHSSICPNRRCKAIIGKMYTDANFYCAYAKRRQDDQ